MPYHTFGVGALRGPDPASSCEFRHCGHGGRRKLFLPGNQTFVSPGLRQAEGDWSNGAFFLTAASLGSQVTCKGLDPLSKQGDKAIVQLLRLFHEEEERVVDVSQIPDLVPILSVKAALTPGVTRITNAARLRIKESDRLLAVAENLTALGGNVEALSDGLVIEGEASKADKWMVSTTTASSCPWPLQQRDAKDRLPSSVLRP